MDGLEKLNILNPACTIVCQACNWPDLWLQLASTMTATGQYYVCNWPVLWLQLASTMAATGQYYAYNWQYYGSNWPVLCV